MVLSIVDNINNWLDATKLNTSLGIIFLIAVIVIASVIALDKVKMPRIITLMMIMVEVFLFILLGWIPTFIAFVMGIVFFLILVMVARGGGGVTIDD